jgi:hypothetical protein
MGQGIALEMHAAALPGGGQDACGGRLDTLVRVRDDQLHARQAAPDEIAEELGPEGLGLRSPDRHAQHLAPAVRVDADREGDGNADDATALAHLQIRRIDPQVGPFAFDRAGQEGINALVDFLAQPAYLALGNAGPAHRLHEVIHGAGRHAMNVGFLDHCRQRLFDGTPRLEEGRKI